MSPYNFPSKMKRLKIQEGLPTYLEKHDRPIDVIVLSLTGLLILLIICFVWGTFTA